MHLSISRASLLQQVQHCQGIVEKRSTKPILCNLFLHAENQTLKIIGTDLQMAISASVETKVIEPGETTVSAQKLFEIIKELDTDKEIELKTKDSFLVIKSGRSRFRLSTMGTDDYPGMPDDDTDMSFDLDSQQLAKMIAGTAFAMSNDETRKYLTGTLFETDEKLGFRMVSTDSHRLALVELALDASLEAVKCIVPKKTVIEMKKISEEQSAPVHLSLGVRQVRMQCGPYTLSSKVIDATFPAYEEVIPKQNPRQVDVSCKNLDQSLRRSMIVANEVTHDVRLTFTSEGLQVAAHNTDQEQAEEFVEVDIQGPETVIGFNGRYLRDVLSVVDTEQVSIHFRDELSPVLLTTTSESGSKYVVMPMRI
ncbi:MAG: DNA polymerase III subunit beta [Mariprofundaceae bacterium]|nr:DNA polymerase III subunit beta [Mariprofundaceae bacterium]